MESPCSVDTPLRCLTLELVNLIKKNGGEIDIAKSNDITDEYRQCIYDVINVLVGLGIVKKRGSLLRWCLKDEQVDLSNLPCPLSMKNKSKSKNESMETEEETQDDCQDMVIDNQENLHISEPRQQNTSEDNILAYATEPIEIATEVQCATNFMDNIHDIEYILYTTRKNPEEAKFNRRTAAVQTMFLENRTCGVIGVSMNNSTFTLNCYHCSLDVPISNWKEFVTHVQTEHHPLQHLYINKNIITEECDIAYGNNAKEYDIKETTSNEEDNDIDGVEKSLTLDNIKEEDTRECAVIMEIYKQDGTLLGEPLIIEEGIDDIIEEIQDNDEECRYDDNGIENCITIYSDDDVGADDANNTQKDNVEIRTDTTPGDDAEICDEESSEEGEDNQQIRFGKTDDAAVVDFLETLKQHPILCHLQHMPLKQFRAAINEVIAYLNQRWLLSMTYTTLIQSLNRLKDWFCREMHWKEKRPGYQIRYQAYFEKCMEFLPVNEYKLQLTVPCIICKRNFLNELQLKRHKFRCHKLGVHPFKCHICEKLIATEDGLRNHEANHKEFDCDICGKRFTSSHTRRLHKLLHAPPKFSCEYCSKPFRLEHRMKQHLKEHTNERDYICEECGKTFVYQKKYMEHMKGVHWALYKCQICQKQLTKPAYLRKHQEKYHQVLIGLNDEIMQGLKRKFKPRTKRHIYVQDPITKRYRLLCEICKKTYSDHSSLQQHSIKEHGYYNFKIKRSK